MLLSERALAWIALAAWLATLVSLWSIEAGGRAALAASGCPPQGARDQRLALKTPSSAEDILDVLGCEDSQALIDCDTAKGSCTRGRVAAETRRDSLFLVPSYGILTLTLFAWCGVRRMRRGRRRLTVMFSVGMLAVLVAVLADLSENGRVMESLRLATAEPDLLAIQRLLPYLAVSTTVKWLALAACCALLALTLDRAGLWVWVVRLIGLAAAGLLTIGVLGPLSFIEVGAICLFLFWSAAAVHAATLTLRDRRAESVNYKTTAGG